MADNTLHVEEAKRLFNTIFSNTSVPQEQTLDDLEDLDCELQSFIDALREDIGRG